MMVNIGSLSLKNPVILASGTCSPDLQKFTDLSKLGAVVTKSVTLNPKTGNPPPRTVETPCGMLNSIGLENPGVEKFKIDMLLDYIKYADKTICSVSGETPDEYVEVVKKLNDTDVDGFEINVSCPNVERGGIEFGKDEKIVYEITKSIKSATKKPIIIKLSPNVSDIESIAKAAESGGANGISLINTLYGMTIDINTKKPKLGNITGGLSGPCIKPIALYYVYKVAKVVKIPVIGIGGIMNTEDAIEFFIAGATAIEIGTANFVNPNTGIEIVKGLAKYNNEP